MSKANSWSRWEHLELLDVESDGERAWVFYWPGRMLVQPLGDGVEWKPNGECRPVPLGTVLVAPASAGHVRMDARAGASFRVIFESRPSDESPPVGRVDLPQVHAVSSDLSDPLAIFQESFAYLESTSPVSVRVSPAVARARTCLERALAQAIDLETLGATVGSERCHLCRTFQKAIGLPPYRFRAQLRVARARLMLAEGYDCTEVAHALGFCDQSHLTRAFKEAVGTTPGAYAKALRSRSDSHPQQVLSAA